LGPTAAGFVLLIGVAGIAYLGLSEERRASAFWAAGATVSVVVLLSIRIAVPYFSRYFIAPPQELAYVAGVNLKPQDRLIFYGPPKPSLLFYARRHAIVISPGQENNMRSYLTSASRTLILLPSRLKPHLPAEAKNFSLLLEHYGYSLLSNEPMVRLPSVPSPSRPGAHGLPQ
jgi:hypothetical protein